MGAATRTLFVSIIPVVLALLAAALPMDSATAQDSDISLRTALSRYAGATRNSPTVDAELARRLFRRGNTYSNLERYDDAIEEFEQSVAADPNFAEGYRNLANLHYFLGNFPQAKLYYARFITLTLDEEPDTTVRTALSNMGRMERQDGNYQESIAFDLRAIELDPGNDSQVHIMGNTYNNGGDVAKAIRIYQAGIAAQPDNAFFYRTLGRLYEQEGRLEEALTQYEYASERDPESEFYAGLVETLRARLGR